MCGGRLHVAPACMVLMGAGVCRFVLLWFVVCLHFGNVLFTRHETCVFLLVGSWTVLLFKKGEGTVFGRDSGGQNCCEDDVSCCAVAVPSAADESLLVGWCLSGRPKRTACGRAQQISSAVIFVDIQWRHDDARCNKFQMKRPSSTTHACRSLHSCLGW